MVFSLASTMIENPGGRYDKQDCELKAFYRFIPMLRELYPKMPMCLLLDSLYAGEPVLKLCEKHNLSFFIVFTQGSIPTLWDDAQRWVGKHPQATGTHRPDPGTTQVLRWAPGLKYRNNTVHFISCEEISDGAHKPTRWAWITDIRPNAQNVHRLVNGGARLRWRIENEGFNVQKNGELALVHGYGGRDNALHGYYLLAQVAHMIMQIIARSDLLRKVRTEAHKITTSVLSYYTTMRNLVERIRESLRRDRLTDHGARRFPATFQIRLDTS